MKRVLLVDDNEFMRASLIDALVVSGYDALAASNGMEALEILASGQEFDVIVTDIIMPKMDGIQFIMEVRDVLPNIKLVAISGGSDRLMKESGLDTAKRLGANAVIPKPFDVETLLAALEEAKK